MDTVDPLRFVFAFLFVLGLIGLLAFGLKRYGKLQGRFGQAFLRMKEGENRLTVLEIRYIDPKRKLALIRRDDKEHLLLLSDGPNGRELIIESGIPGKADAKTDEHHT